MSFFLLVAGVGMGGGTADGSPAETHVFYATRGGVFVPGASVGGVFTTPNAGDVS